MSNGKIDRTRSNQAIPVGRLVSVSVGKQSKLPRAKVTAEKYAPVKARTASQTCHQPSRKQAAVVGGVVQPSRKHAAVIGGVLTLLVLAILGVRFSFSQKQESSMGVSPPPAEENTPIAKNSGEQPHAADKQAAVRQGLASAAISPLVRENVDTRPRMAEERTDAEIALVRHVSATSANAPVGNDLGETRLSKADEPTGAEKTIPRPGEPASKPQGVGAKTEGLVAVRSPATEPALRGGRPPSMPTAAPDPVIEKTPPNALAAVVKQSSVEAVQKPGERCGPTLEVKFAQFGKVNFLSQPSQAYEMARQEKTKLVMVLHIAGNFEDTGFT